MKTYLVEKYDREIEFDKDSIVVALTPEVCYQLDKRGIKYSIIEDFYDEAELSAQEDEYYTSQLKWFNGLDGFLKRNIREVKGLNINLGTIFYLNIKGMVLDPIYIRCYTLRKLFEAVNPSSVVFISQPPQKSSLNYALQDNSQSYYSLLIQMMCSQFNIPLKTVFIEPEVKKAEQPIMQRGTIVARLKRVLAKIEIVRKILFYSKYLKKRLAGKRECPKKLNIFLLTVTHLREDSIADALLRGHSVYLLSDNSIRKYSCLGASRYLDLKVINKASEKADDWESAANQLGGDDLLKRINENCRLNIAAIVLPKLQYFISVVCPDIVRYFKTFSEFYKKNKVNFVITPYEVHSADFAAVAAANNSRDTKSVNLQHGDSIFAANFWNVIYLSRFDIDISTNEEIREYFNYQCQVNRYTTRLFRSPNRLLPIKRIYYSRQKRKPSKRNRIVYVPTMFRGNYGRFDCAHYPDTWYYILQKELIEYFATKKEYAFIWKGIPAADLTYNPIPDFIADNHFANIEIATNPFIEHLHSADKAIFDYPSTAFYEAVVAGVPAFSLYHKTLKVRQSALAYFGIMLKSFSNTDDAIKHVDAFLHSNPEEYQITFDLEGKSILDILEGVSKEESENYQT